MDKYEEKTYRIRNGILISTSIKHNISEIFRHKPKKGLVLCAGTDRLIVSNVNNGSK